MIESDGPSVDLAAVRHDDEFLTALSTGGYARPLDGAEAELGELLYAWRAETLAAPANPLSLADVENAIAAEAARADSPAKRRSTRMRHLRVLSGAAAIAAVAAAGLLVMSDNSQPGDPLWNVKKVVFSEAAAQTEATVDAQVNLERAEQALAHGDIDEATALVNSAEARLQPVSDPATRQRLEQWIRRLRGEGTTPPVAATTSTSVSTHVPGPEVLTTDESVPSTDEAATGTESTTPPETTSSATTTPTKPTGSASTSAHSGAPSSTVTTTSAAGGTPASVAATITVEK
ncbi:MAG: anti-sigma-D factor RsdA [Gordonia sp. (in: high G+C Gram-positive bacteria)]|uniref:anti-sigma-D factor RsdA n=1 Tax=Gordonia sp. (in: high G+C Gram-positive bacteria) TaxID=84139 RepID=UPI003BB7B569